MDKDKIAELREHHDNTDVAEHFTRGDLRCRPPGRQGGPGVHLDGSPPLVKPGLGASRRARHSSHRADAATVIERATSPTTAAAVSVADLQRFIAEQFRPVASFPDFTGPLSSRLRRPARFKRTGRVEQRAGREVSLAAVGVMIRSPR